LALPRDGDCDIAERSGIGAFGLCTVTSTDVTLASARQAVAIRPASVSSKFTGSPLTIAAIVAASAP
jgi:hypothetical protein